MFLVARVISCKIAGAGLEQLEEHTLSVKVSTTGGVLLVVCNKSLTLADSSQNI